MFFARFWEEEEGTGGQGVMPHSASLWALALATAWGAPTADRRVPVGATLVRFQHTTGQCLGMHMDPGPWFPCAGGAANSCPTALLPCSAPQAQWSLDLEPGFLCNAFEGPQGGACISIDCDSVAPGAVAKVIAGPDAWFSRMNFTSGQLVYTARGGQERCLGLPTAAAPVTPPCSAGEEYLTTGIIIDYCSINSTQGWVLLGP